MEQDLLDRYRLVLADRTEIRKTIKLENIFEKVTKSSPEKWQAIRAMYKLLAASGYTAYPVDWTLVFTPIESMAWGEIRSLGLPFCPQYPIGKYFADFADPAKKVVIECDGSKFHSKEKDAPRDRYMTSEGWDVFRISGSDCNRILTNPWEQIRDEDIERGSDQANEIITKWFHETVDGLILAIRINYYKQDGYSDHAIDTAYSVLRKRISRG